METFQYHVMLNSIFLMLNGINKYLEIRAPWNLAKDAAKKDQLVSVLNNAAETIRLSAYLLWPFIPDTCDEILKRLGQAAIQDVIDSKNLQQTLSWGQGRPATVTVGPPLFMRLT